MREACIYAEVQKDRGEIEARSDATPHGESTLHSDEAHPINNVGSVY